jgi:hypothetical protein
MRNDPPAGDSPRDDMNRLPSFETLDIVAKIVGKMPPVRRAWFIEQFEFECELRATGEVHR